MKIYALKLKNGCLDSTTVSTSREECWFASFETIAGIEGEEWRNRFWKRLGPSRLSATRRGYKIVPVAILELR